MWWVSEKCTRTGMKPFKHGFNCGYILTSHKCCAGFLKLDDQHSAKRTEFTFFLSLLCLSASIRCLCFSSFFSIISFTCFTPSKVPFSSSSTYCSPAAESPAHTRGTQYFKLCNSNHWCLVFRFSFPSAKALLFSVSSLIGGESAAQSMTSAMKRI